jgi:hypothetical protein
MKSWQLEAKRSQQPVTLSTLIAIGIYIRNIVLLGRRNSMCVHMQKPFEPGQAHFITCVAS